MEKEFCTYNQALKLKALGFDEPCFAVYLTDSEKLVLVGSTERIKPKMKNFNAPTFSQVFKWFREKYNLHGFVMDNEDEHFWWGISILFSGETEEDSSEIAYDETYEEAELACLEKLLEIVESKTE